MNCRKCGAELHPEQKVCIQCGERTAAGGKFDVEEEQHWRPSPKQIRIVAGVAAVLLIVLLLYKVLHVTPPEVVAKEWFDAMLSRQFNVASRYVTPGYEQDLATRMMDPRSLADTYVEEVTTNRATYEISPPVFDSPSRPRRAAITITTKATGGQIVRQIQVQMAKVGRAWRVDQVM